MILTILGEDLLSMLNGTRSKPIATSTNPTGFTERRIIVEANGEDAILNADDVFYYLHDSRRLYIATTIAIPESLQYMSQKNVGWRDPKEEFHFSLMLRLGTYTVGFLESQLWLQYIVVLSHANRKIHRLHSESRLLH